MTTKKSKYQTILITFHSDLLLRHKNLSKSCNKNILKSTEKLVRNEKNTFLHKFQKIESKNINSFKNVRQRL